MSLRSRRLRATRLTLAIAALVAVVAADGVRSADYQNPSAPLETRVEDLLARLTLAEKISLMAGGSAFATQPIPRLGIPALQFSDGPNGVRSNSGVPATVFPTGSALAATWNPRVIEEVGGAIGREARALNIAVMLGPNVNIQREPLAGRNFESYSEDPFLAGTIGAAMVRGIQSEGVGTSVKHFVGNEQELERMRSSSDIDERTLREIYLLPFEMIVKQAHPWTVMASYNRLNGLYMSENRRLVHDVLEDEWGFDGVVMSDWGAVHSTVAAASSGLDLEMPGPANYFGARLQSAVTDWQVSESAIDDAARRMVRLIIRSGALDGVARLRGELRSEGNRAAALAAAREAITLLKNENELLPLDRARIRTLAVIGPDADVPLYEGGGSAHVIAGSGETPLMSLKRLAGAAVRILYAKGVDNDAVPPPADERLLTPSTARSGRGLAFRYFANPDFAGSPARSGIAEDFDQTLLATELGRISARWDGYLWPAVDGEYEFSLSQIGTGRLYIDGRELIGPDEGSTLPPQIDFGANVRLAKMHLAAGSRHAIRVEYVSGPATFHYLHLGLRAPPGTIADAVSAARSADAAIVFVGSSRSSETEGRDRANMQLEGRQNELVEAILAANPRTVVVLENGAPYALPWAQRAPAIVEGFFAGERGPDALAEILFGDTDPSGKLPFTVPARLEDNPAYLYYGGGRDAMYGEGVFVGYRSYDKRNVAPLFPFGYGLSYTTFRYSNLRVPRSAVAGEPVDVSVDLTNDGRRPGEETVELYVGDEATTEVVRPVKELKGFEKVPLAPGETRTVRFTLTPRDFSYYDVHGGKWTSTAGRHRILIGSSSRDIREQQDFELTRAPGS